VETEEEIQEKLDEFEQDISSRTVAQTHVSTNEADYIKSFMTPVELEKYEGKIDEYLSASKAALSYGLIIEGSTFATIYQSQELLD